MYHEHLGKMPALLQYPLNKSQRWMLHYAFAQNQFLYLNIIFEIKMVQLNFSLRKHTYIILTPLNPILI